MMLSILATSDQPVALAIIQRPVYISELAAIIDRRPNTVRGWLRDERLPAELRPQRRGETGWRCWTVEQVTGILAWMSRERMVPGSGLTHFDPDPAKVDELLAGLRRPRLDRRRAA